MKHLFLIICLTLSACSLSGEAEIGLGDVADATTTAVGLSKGLAEANPAMAWAGDGAPIVAIGIKYSIKELLIQSGVEPTVANNAIDSLSYGAACNNILAMSGTAFPYSLIGIPVCGVLSWELQNMKGR